jgi:hypothetical protein
MTTLADDRYIVISLDGHAGAQVQEYRDNFESKYHDEFDTCEATVVNPFADLRADFAYVRLRERRIVNWTQTWDPRGHLTTTWPSFTYF